MKKFYRTFLATAFSIMGLAASAAPVVIGDPLEGSLPEFPDKMVIIYSDYSSLALSGAQNQAIVVYNPDNTSETFNAKVEMNGTQMTNRVYFTWDDKKPTAPGEYSILVKSDQLKDVTNGSTSLTCEDAILHYTLDDAAGLDYEVTPAPGKVDVLPSRVTVTFPADFEIKDGDAPWVTIEGPAGYEANFTPEKTAERTLAFDWTPLPTEPGAYTVKITNIGFTTPQPDVEYEFTYILQKNNTATYEYVAAPAPGEISNFPSTISVTISGFDSVFPRTGMNPAATIECPDGSILNCEVQSPEYTNTVVLNVSRELTKPGFYKVTLNCEALCNENIEPLKGIIEFEYILGARSIIYNPMPGITGNIEKLTYTIRNAQNVTISDAPDAISFTDSKGATVDFTAKAEDNVITITPATPVTEEGVYTVEIKAGSLTIDGEVYVLPISAVYEVSASGVTGITSADCEIDVYGIDGTLRLRKASSDDLRTLAPGIYVAGGKKIIIRR